MKVGAGVLWDAIKFVRPAVARDERRPMLTCVLIEHDGSTARVMAADNYRLRIAPLAQATTEEPLSAPIPRPQLKLLRAFLRTHTGTVDLTRQGQLLIVGANGESVSIPLMEGQYPTTATVVGRVKPAVVFSVDPRKLADLADMGSQVRVALSGPRDPIRFEGLGGTEYLMPVVETTTEKWPVDQELERAYQGTGELLEAVAVAREKALEIASDLETALRPTPLEPAA